MFRFWNFFQGKKKDNRKMMLYVQMIFDNPEQAFMVREVVESTLKGLQFLPDVKFKSDVLCIKIEEK